MDIAAQLTKLIDENIGGLTTLRKAPGLDGQVNKVDFSIRMCNVTIKDDKTLDVEVLVKPLLKQSEYAGLEDYWIDVKPRFQSAIEPGLKAKEAYELLYAVLLYDGTTSGGKATPQRARVQAALEGLITHYTSKPAAKQTIFRYQGRDSKTPPGSKELQFHQSMFLEINRSALHTLLFSQKAVIDELDAKASELAAGNFYRKNLAGIQDSVAYKLRR